MGAWSHESFGNDYACDWVSEVVEGEEFEAWRAAIQELRTRVRA